jgi:hypothetical protein
MRIHILGNNDTANTLRGYLQQAGLAVVDKRPDITLSIEEQPGPAYISFDSLESALERELLKQVRKRIKAPLLLAHGTHRRGEHYLHITVPDNDSARIAVEQGVLQGVLEWMKHRQPKRRFWHWRNK